MTAYSDDFATFSDFGFQQRCIMSLYNQAVAIYFESNLTPGHAARAGYATKILSGQINVQQLVIALAAQHLTLASTDAQIDTTVDTLFNSFAGV